MKNYYSFGGHCLHFSMFKYSCDRTVEKRLIETLSFLSNLCGFRVSRKNEGTCPSVLYVGHPVHLVNLCSTHLCLGQLWFWYWILHFLCFIHFRISLKIKKLFMWLDFVFSPQFHSSDNVSHASVMFETDKNETFRPFGIPLSFRSPSPLVSLQAVKER